MWPCDLSWIFCWLNSPYPHSTSRWGIHGCELGYSGWYSSAFHCESCFILFRGMVVYQNTYMIWSDLYLRDTVDWWFCCFPSSQLLPGFLSFQLEKLARTIPSRSYNSLALTKSNREVEEAPFEERAPCQNNMKPRNSLHLEKLLE